MKISKHILPLRTKLNLSPYLIQQQASKKYAGVELQLLFLVTLAVGCLPSRPGHYVPAEKVLGSGLIKNWVGPEPVSILCSR